MALIFVKIKIKQRPSPFGYQFRLNRCCSGCNFVCVLGVVLWLLIAGCLLFCRLFISSLRFSFHFIFDRMRFGMRWIFLSFSINVRIILKQNIANEMDFVIQMHCIPSSIYQRNTNENADKNTVDLTISWRKSGFYVQYLMESASKSTWIIEWKPNEILRISNSIHKSID